MVYSNLSRPHINDFTLSQGQCKVNDLPPRYCLVPDVCVFVCDFRFPVSVSEHALCAYVT